MLSGHLPFLSIDCTFQVLVSSSFPSHKPRQNFPGSSHLTSSRDQVELRSLSPCLIWGSNQDSAMQSLRRASAGSGGHVPSVSFEFVSFFFISHHLKLFKLKMPTELDRRTIITVALLQISTPVLEACSQI
ncbi:hypothetical protein ACMFMF_010922 [Clarireedia jacksonii]